MDVSEAAASAVIRILAWAFFIKFFISIILAKQFQRIAEMKGHPESRWFWLPFLFKIAGWIAVAALPDRGCAVSAPPVPDPASRPVNQPVSQPVFDDAEIPEL